MDSTSRSAPSHSHSHSLIELLRKNIIGAISSTVKGNRWRVVVVDRPSLKIVSMALEMQSILEQNVIAVQLITRNRQAIRNDAIYILVPCADSVMRMIDDFKPDPGHPENPQTKYARAHLFFTGKLPELLFSQLASSTAAPYIKGVTELFVEYNPFESRVFLTTPSEQPFYSLYSPHAADKMERDLDAASDRLLSVIAALEIHPFVRFYRPANPTSSNSSNDSGNDSSQDSACPRIAEAMARRFQLKLNEHYAHEYSDTDNKDPRQQQSSDSVVIVLDRSIDIFAPLVHELTYQAMVHDIIDLGDGAKYIHEKKTANGQVERVEAELSEKTDWLWEKLRHEHIGSVAQKLSDRIERLMSENTGIKAAQSDGKKLTITEMKAALAELPEFKRLQSLYSLHSDLATQCLEISSKRNLPALVNFEQEIVTQTSADGKHVGQMSLETRLIALLDDKGLDKSDRIRLLFLYLVYANGGSAEDRRRLEEVPQCLTINDKHAAINLRQLGIPTNKKQSELNKPSAKKTYSWDTFAHADPDKHEPWFVPAVKRIIFEQLNGDLDDTLFPWTRETLPENIPKHILNVTATSLRRNKGTWERKQQHSKSEDSGKGTVIIYIAGGMTFSEMRTVYEMSRKYKRQIFIGSTHIITPRGFLEDMKSLHLEMLM
ncbi:Sec1-like protein [Kickxella alabastrina]|uniref:Sec1-like protein n=1 Tax=Kickxella alabastrina TaxID=61397 RepID=UPI00221E5825|nr:Sec1-like protein [Kickxella alabastrina]KAI7824165.1 Sec1-like protein [Kickxella alabastrina]